jgi:hypothetical protein
MQGHHITHQVVETGEHFLAHVLAIGIGFAIMIVGVAMCVSIVMLPVGLPLGLFGLALFMWGLYHRRAKANMTTTSPEQP